MSKQTAVEWLWRWINDNQEATIEQGNEAFEQAKEMHKQEVGDTWDAAILAGSKRGGNIMRAWEDFDEYYQETFKKD